ncbi:MAG: OmpA family protein [Flavobacteriaceae bacterium]|nr:OmpA family protein [Flavobacteriaceae bacterium]
MENFGQKQEGESQWLPISDLMSVLMMVFLLIAVSYMLKVYLEKEKIQEVAVTYNKLQNELYDDLNLEFEEDLKKWNAEIDKASLSVRFKSPDILFNMGSANLKPEFKSILADFFPRFIAILHKDGFRNDIDEIRIEGHTSSHWRAETTEEKAYIYNMELSQNRTRNVLDYVLRNETDDNLVKWIRLNVTANGLSSSKLIFNDDGTQNRELSRRVEFRVKTNAEKRITKILGK